MKKFGLFILVLILSHAALAYDTARLKLKVAGQIQPNDFLCINNMGCFAMNAGANGHIFMIDLQTINSFALLNLKTTHAYAQTLPTSCKVAVLKNQTLVISGQVKHVNDIVAINQLRCELL